MPDTRGGWTKVTSAWVRIPSRRSLARLASLRTHINTIPAPTTATTITDDTSQLGPSWSGPGLIAFETNPNSKTRKMKIAYAEIPEPLIDRSCWGSEAASPDVVVSQLYGGGGNSGATYANDFVELFNRGATAVDLGTWSIQYASG